MRKKRLKSILAMILTASMVLGSGINVSGTEIGAGAGGGIIQSAASENESLLLPEEKDLGTGEKTESENGAEDKGTDELKPGSVPEGDSEKTPVAEETGGKKASENEAVSENAEVSGNEGISGDEVPEAVDETEDEEAAGATVSPNLFVSGNTVSYNGKDQELSISVNKITDVYYVRYQVISANDPSKKDPWDYKASFSSNGWKKIEGLKGEGVEKGKIEGARDAGTYAVSVDMVSINVASSTSGVVSNNIVFLTVNPAAPISVSVDGLEKFYDGTPLKASENKPYALAGSGEIYGNDLDRITVSGELTNVGTKRIELDVSAISKNYAKISVSSGLLRVKKSNIVITSRDYFKHYDGKRVEDADRQGFTLKATDEGVDSEVLLKSLSWNNSSFEWDPSSLITGDEVTESENRFRLTRAEFNKVSANFATIRYKFGTIRVKKHVWNSNSLVAPVITTVKMNNKGWITVSFKGAKVFKNQSPDDKRMNQARYFIYRYDEELMDWVCLNGNNTTNEKKKAEEIEFGQTGRTFVDKQAGRLDKSTYIYRVNVIGYDESGKYGMNKNTSDNYKMCQAIPLEVGTRQKDPKSIDFEFSKIRGAASYYIERSSTNKKDSFTEVASMNASSKNERSYSGSKLVSAKSFNDKGQIVSPMGEKLPAEAAFYTDSPVAENTNLFYRVKAVAYVRDFDESGKMLPARKVESDLSPSLKGKNGVRPPEILAAGSASYNHAVIVFEKLSSNEFAIGYDKEFAKNKYQILKATKVDGTYSVAKTVTGRQLAGEFGDIAGFYELKKGQEILMGEFDYVAEKDCYAATFTNLKPEITYYYKVRAVRNNVAGTPGNYKTVRPLLNEVSWIDAVNKNYNQITVSTDFIPGATQMVVTYRAIKDPVGAVIEEGAGKDGTWVSKVFTIKKDAKTKKPVMQFVVGGLKHGYTYMFYAEPKYGKKHEGYSVVDTEYTRPGKTVVKASPKSLTEVYVQWASVPGATQYKLDIYDAEDDTPDKAPVKTQYFKTAGKHTWKGGTSGVIDGKTKVEDLSNAGKPYTFVVTPFKKDSYYKEGYGNEGDSSAPVTEAGRPRAVTNLKAAVNSVNSDAKLTWSQCADNTKNTPISYMIEREVYKYTVGTANTFSKTGVSSNIMGYKNNYKKLTYASTTQVIGKEFSSGDKVVYKITPVYDSKVPGRGANKDGFILGVPAKVNYITPYSITINGRTEMTVGETKTVGISFKPTSCTVKAVNWISAGNNDYFTMNGASLTGKKTSGDWNNGIYVQAISKANGIASNVGLVKINAKPVSSSLKVCIDAGHGGEDSGATYGGVVEKNCNLDMAQAMRSRLESYGVPVVMTRTGDSYLTVGARPEVAYNNGCNLFISIHCNSGGGAGTEVYKSITQYHDDDLASRILSKITSTIGTGSRGVKTRTGQNGDYYGVIRGSAARGINGMIVEVAFVDGDKDKLSNYNTRVSAGTAIADAVLEKYGYK